MNQVESDNARNATSKINREKEAAVKEAGRLRKEVQRKKKKADLAAGLRRME